MRCLQIVIMTNQKINREMFYYGGGVGRLRLVNINNC